MIAAPLLSLHNKGASRMDKGMHTEQSGTSYLVTCIRWMGVWILGVVIGVPMMGIVYASKFGVACTAITGSIISSLMGTSLQSAVLAEDFNRIILSLIPGIVVGTLVGFIQFVILNNSVSLHRWIPMSILGSAVGWWTASTLFAPVNSLILTSMHRVIMVNLGSFDSLASSIIAGSVVGCLGGVIVGLAQWVVLRNHGKNSYWWILANAIGWCMIWIFGGAIYAAVILSSDRVVF